MITCKFRWYHGLKNFRGAFWESTQYLTFSLVVSLPDFKYIFYSINNFLADKNNFLKAVVVCRICYTAVIQLVMLSNRNITRRQSTSFSHCHPSLNNNMAFEKQGFAIKSTSASGGTFPYHVTSGGGLSQYLLNCFLLKEIMQRRWMGKTFRPLSWLVEHDALLLPEHLSEQCPWQLLEPLTNY